MKQCLEGLVTKQVIQEFAEKEAPVKQQVEADRSKLEAFEEALPRSE